jgi:predicted Zn-dependent peptidase
METKRLEKYEVPVFYTTAVDAPDVITIFDEHSPTVTCEILFSSGGVDDVKPGTAHFLEHMVYGGEERGMHPALKQLIPKGVQGNAGTGFWHSEFWLNGFREDLQGILEALTDMCTRIVLTEASVRAEAPVILRERVGRERGSSLSVWLRRQLYPNSPHFHRSNIGDSNSIKSMTPDDLRAFVNANYVRRRACVICRGAVDHDALVRSVYASALMSLPVGEKAVRPILEYVPVRARYEGKSVSAPAVELFLPDVDDKDGIAIGIAANLLGSAYGTLRERLRVNEGKIYSISASSAGWPENYCSIEAAADPSDFDHIEEVIFEEIERIARGDIPDDPFLTAKNRRRKFFATNRRDPLEHLKWLEQGWLEGSLEKLVNGVEITNSLTKQHVSDAVSRYWKRERTAVFHYLPA